jgi:hypothetical protein
MNIDENQIGIVIKHQAKRKNRKKKLSYKTNKEAYTQQQKSWSSLAWCNQRNRQTKLQEKERTKKKKKTKIRGRDEWLTDGCMGHAPPQPWSLKRGWERSVREQQRNNTPAVVKSVPPRAVFRALLRNSDSNQQSNQYETHCCRKIREKKKQRPPNSPTTLDSNRFSRIETENFLVFFSTLDQVDGCFACVVICFPLLVFRVVCQRYHPYVSSGCYSFRANVCIVSCFCTNIFFSFCFYSDRFIVFRMQQGRAPCIAYFESNCNTKPHASLLAELLVLCRGGDAAALTCFKQLFGPRIHVWMLFSVQERQATVKTLVDLLDVVGSTPLMCYVSARSLYTEGCFSLLRLANVHLVRELLLAVKDDIEKGVYFILFCFLCMITLSMVSEWREDVGGRAGAARWGCVE